MPVIHKKKYLYMQKIKIKIDGLTFYYNQKRILKDISVNIEESAITTIAGPSGVGKSTFLMVMNRLYESIPGCKVKGKVEIKCDGDYLDIRKLPLTTLRRKVGMVFQNPNPLPMSIFKNVAFPLKLSGIKNQKHIKESVEKGLRDVCLWDEVNNRLGDSAIKLSGGQQQRLCLARAIIMTPEVLMLDEPTASLDMEASAKIEELLKKLKDKGTTLIIVSHYADLTKRISDHVLTLRDGRF